jgi:hypothetical protein
LVRAPKTCQSREESLVPRRNLDCKIPSTSHRTLHDPHTRRCMMVQTI